MKGGAFFCFSHKRPIFHTRFLVGFFAGVYPRGQNVVKYNITMPSLANWQKPSLFRKRFVLKILCIGDVVGTPGVETLRKKLPALKRELGADLCTVNGENADAGGVGITPGVAQEIFSLGADVITTGNHALRRATADVFEETPALLCPANAYYTGVSSGVYLHDMGRAQVAVINLMGAAFMGPVANPFLVLDDILKTLTTPHIVVDFHAESTAEKKALAYYAAGRVSALFGTHTHVQTNDATVLPGGTGYMTDLGMTGPVHSVLGVTPALAIEKQKTQGTVRFAVASGPCVLEGVLFETEDATGRCLAATPVQLFDV